MQHQHKNGLRFLEGNAINIDIEKLKSYASKLRISLSNVVKVDIIEKGLWNKAIKSTGRTTTTSERQPLLPATSPRRYDVNDITETKMDIPLKSYIDIFAAEIDKVDDNYGVGLAILKDRVNALLDRCERADMGRDGDQYIPEFTELYQSIFELRGYASTNMGLVIDHLQSSSRIRSTFLKSKNQYLDTYLLDFIQQKEGMVGHSCKALGQTICNKFAAVYCRGDLRLAHFRLLESQSHDIDWNCVYLGMWMGSALVLALWLLTSEYLEDKYHGQLFMPPVLSSTCSGVRVFRIVGLLLLMAWGVGIQIAVWRMAKVNAPVIFGIPAYMWPDTATFFMECARFSVFYIICLILLLKSFRQEFDLNPAWFPIAVMFVATGVAFRLLYKWFALSKTALGVSNVEVFQNTLRETFWFVVGMSEKSFLVTYVCDYLTSSSKILAEFLFVFCDIFSDGFSGFISETSNTCSESHFINMVAVPAIMMWPLWLRVGQNLTNFYTHRTPWPFVPNALKYLLAHTIVIFTTLHPDLMRFGTSTENVGWKVVFITCFVLSTTFTFLWDVLMDWSLGNRASGYLRRRRMLSRDSFYYACIFADFFMRYVWAFTLVPNFQESFLLSIPGFTTGVEVIRRTYWGIIRVENEHVNNTRNFRNVKFIPLYFDAAPPTEKSTANIKRPSVLIGFEIFLLIVIFAALALVAVILG